MKILGIDSSGLVASVALVEDDVLVAEETVNFKKTHSQTLLPMLSHMAEEISIELREIDAIAVAAGPGSFTGLRIGSATAKGLALVLEKPIVPVSTLEALAYNVCGAEGLICPIMDARRSQVYAGVYTFAQENAKREDSVTLAPPAESGSFFDAGMPRVLLSPTALPVEELAKKIYRLGDGAKALFLGDGVPVYREALSSCMRLPYFFAPAPNNRQRAASVAALGMRYFKESKIQTADEHAPIYLRPSQAERERAEAEQARETQLKAKR